MTSLTMPGQYICWYQGDSSRRRWEHFLGRRNCPRYQLCFRPLRWLVIGYRRQNTVASFLVRRPGDRERPLYPWNCYRQEMASDAELTRRGVSSAYTRSLNLSQPTTISGFTDMCRRIQSMAMVKMAGARTQPCLTPDVVWRRPERGQEDIYTISSSTDRDWTFVNTSSVTELCHIGIHCRLVLLKPIQS